LTGALESRAERGLLRVLVEEQEPNAKRSGADFSSNDYLGLARSEDLFSRIEEEVHRVRDGVHQMGGSTGSRLLTGDSSYARMVETELASFHACESALLFNSGYDANVSVFSTLPQPDGVVFFDELMHASCREGLALCRSRTREFKHNSMDDLERLLLEEEEHSNHNKAPGSVRIIAIESVYSMDGHVAPLAEISKLASKYKCDVIIDEAHGTGVFGEEGQGYWQHHLALVDSNCPPFARIHTFGKALGAHGAVVVGSRVLRSYLLNYAKPLIFSTAMPTHSLVSIRCSYAYMRLVIKYGIDAVQSPSPIQAIIVPGNEQVVRVAKSLRGKGHFVLPIRSPTVPAGTERLRVVLHSYNTAQEVVALVNDVRAILN
jgi:8-amino-7-oxononanoate synthase